MLFQIELKRWTGCREFMTYNESSSFSLISINQIEVLDLIKGLKPAATSMDMITLEIYELSSHSITLPLPHDY